MLRAFAAYRIELTFTAAFAAVTLALGLVCGLPFVLPEGRFASFLGIHYVFPLAAIVTWSLIPLLSGDPRLLRSAIAAIGCYAAILLCHFNLKLWVPLLNPASFDASYYAIDQALRPVVDGAIDLRRMLDPLIPLDSRAYLHAFMGMFYVSLGYHALATPDRFRELAMSVLLLQALGAMAYLIAPALGPFVYEQGVESSATEAQAWMLRVHTDILREGPAWLVKWGGDNFSAGLAAMPSLHAGGSFLFFGFALRTRRWIAVPLGITFAFLCLDAVANRWHYLIDLPAGIALAAACGHLANRLLADPRSAPRRAAPPLREPAAA